MQEDIPVKESFAIPDDDIDIRLIQRQIANAISISNGGPQAATAKKKEAPEENNNEGVTLEHSQKEEAPPHQVEMPSLLKKEDVTIKTAPHSKKVNNME